MNGIERERRYLQRTVAVLAVVPVAAGLFGVLFGPALTGDRVSVSADSHFRYLSGLLLGVGIVFWSTVPAIEEKTGRFRLLALIVVIGGLARLTGLLLTGIPSLYMLGGLVMELVLTPAVTLWQTRVANAYAETAGIADLTRDPA
jgi:membrane associated rhomboid family serine protease